MATANYGMQGAYCFDATVSRNRTNQIGTVNRVRQPEIFHVQKAIKRL